MALPMPNCTQEIANHKIEFDRLGGAVVEGQFDGASMTIDAPVSCYLEPPTASSARAQLSRA